ncbi:hypothetical protein [Haloferula rosea]|uniref:Uncharacterized protein n=1 Tax=Haloferula rosea TaxID=490093 RepID=A0A934RGB7_9BACT|nr:hypothetical protein [Haloferula rosea]MBK1828671.1 hypothetical protein [Haloferula rosea]
MHGMGRGMKGAIWVPPAVAVAVAAGWIGSRKQAVAQMEEEIVVLQARIERAKRDAGAGGEGERRPGRDADGRADWHQVVDWLAAAEAGGHGMRSQMKLQRFILELTDEELIAGIEEMDSLDLGARLKASLESMLIGQLIERDPAVGMGYFHRLDREEHGWMLARGFGRWLESDAGAAMAWFDQEIDKGTFESRSLDGRQEERKRFESVLLRSLLKTNPDAASARLQTMPESLRFEVLSAYGQWNDPGKFEGLAELARANLSAEKCDEVLAQHARHLASQSEGDPRKISQYLEKIEATAEEREHIAESVALTLMMAEGGHQGVLRLEVMEEIQAWVSEEAPGSLGRVTGKILGMQWGDTSREERVELLKKFHAEGMGDELVTTFFEVDGSNRDPEMMRELSALLNDEDSRAALLEAADEQEPSMKESGN